MWRPPPGSPPLLTPPDVSGDERNPPPRSASQTDPQAPRQEGDGRAAAARARAAAAGGGAAQRGPRGGADDPVRGQPAAALEAFDGAARLRAEDAVRLQAQPALHLGDAWSCRAALERPRGGRGRRGQCQRRDAREARGSPSVRCHVPSVLIRFRPIGGYYGGRSYPAPAGGGGARGAWF